MRIVPQVEAIHKRLSKARTDLAPWQDKMQTCRAARELAAAELALLKDRSTQASQRLITVTQDLASAQEAVAMKKAAIARMQV